jgi:hypothetical protein
VDRVILWSFCVVGMSVSSGNILGCLGCVVLRIVGILAGGSVGYSEVIGSLSGVVLWSLHLVVARGSVTCGIILSALVV